LYLQSKVKFKVFIVFSWSKTCYYNIFFVFLHKKSSNKVFKKSTNIAINIESNGETKQAIKQH